MSLSGDCKERDSPSQTGASEKCEERYSLHSQTQRPVSPVLSQTHRPVSPVFSCVSLKSNESKNEILNFSSEPVPSETSERSTGLTQDQSICALRKPVLRDPVSTSCEDSFCCQCISKYLDQSGLSGDSHCPQCGERLGTQLIRHQRDKFILTLDDVLQGTVGHHKTILKSKYKYLFESISQQGKRTLLDSVYTQLYITEGESEGVNEEHEVMKIETASRAQITEDIPINCNDIFKPLTTQGPNGERQEEEIRAVLTKGIAGIGKTVSVQKFILDWADGKANQDVDFLIVLPFRELNMVKDDQYSLHGLVLEFQPELRELDPKKYDDCKMVFIFDGLDECRFKLDFSHKLSDVTMSSSVDILISNLINGNLLPSALIWITSRPAAANQIPSHFISRVTEVQGFSDSQKEEYFRKRVSDENLASRIISHIKTSRTLHIMCHIPVFCWISATVLQKMLNQDNDKEIPKTLTEMYIHFLLIQTNTKNQKYEEKLESNPKDLLEANKEIFLKLAELAFKQLMRGNIMFYEGDLKECGIDVSEATVYSGICTEIFKEEAVLHEKRVYCFVHLSVQEFFAALFVFYCYLCKNMDALKCFLQRNPTAEPENVPLDVLLKKAMEKALESKSGHLDLFIRFLHGVSLESNQSLLQGLLTHTENNSESMKKIVKNLKAMKKTSVNPERWINLLHCLFEMNDISVHQEIQAFLKSKKYTTMLSLAHCTALVYMLLMTEEVLDEFDLNKYNTSEEGRRRLIPAVRCYKKALLAGCNLTEQSYQTVTSALQTTNSPLRELDLSNNDLKDSGVKLLSAGLENPNCKLEILRLSGCLVTEKGCSFLASALCSNPNHLRELDLSYNHPGDSGVKLLSARLNDPCCKLETLKMTHGGENRLKSGLRKYACELMLDPNTAQRELSMSEGNRKVTRGKEQPYPDHPDRFLDRQQVLCREGLTGRCYWEVEWDGRGADIGVTYRGINRAGWSDDCLLGRNDKSWSLDCYSNGYTARHRSRNTRIPASSNRSHRIGVYLDWEAGTLSFYSVSSDTRTLTHIHTYHSTFTEPLYPGFWVGSSLSLC